MFGLIKAAWQRFKDAKAAQRGLTEVFKARGHNFMMLDSTVHEALVKEAIATGVQATMEHFDRIEMHSFGRANEIIQHYKERSKSFDLKAHARTTTGTGRSNFAPAGKDLTLDDSVWQHFQWLPEKLVSMWIVGVKSKHEKHGWGSMPGILWDVDTMTFFGCHDGLMGMLDVATKSWRPNKRHEHQTYLVSIVLSIECLGCDFAGWGTRYPEAKSKADEILDTYFINNRKRLLDGNCPGWATAGFGEKILSTEETGSDSSIG